MSDTVGSIKVRTRIQARDNLGRFVALLEDAAIQTAKDLTDKGVELAKQNASRFRKTGALEAGIQPRYAGKVGYIESTVPYAHPVEAGAIAHAIPRDGHNIMHPGNKAQPYLAQVEKQLSQYAPGIVQRNYPG